MSSLALTSRKHVFLFGCKGTMIFWKQGRKAHYVFVTIMLQGSIVCYRYISDIFQRGMGIKNPVRTPMSSNRICSSSNPQPIGFREILLVKRQKFIYGHRVIGPNGNHIFFPASGCKFTYSEVFKENETGMYWTSTQKGKGKIWCLMFASKFYDIYNGKYNEGYSIRPVW